MSINSKHSGSKNEKSGRRAKRKKTEVNMMNAVFYLLKNVHEMFEVNPNAK